MHMHICICMCICKEKNRRHAKYLAWDDCYLRTRGKVDWAMMIDIDEILAAPLGMAAGLAFCDEQWENSAKSERKIGCSLTSTTVTSVFKPVAPFNTSGKLLLNEYDQVEAAPRCPHTCGRYNRGRYATPITTGAGTPHLIAEGR